MYGGFSLSAVVKKLGAWPPPFPRGFLVSGDPLGGGQAPKFYTTVLWRLQFSLERTLRSPLRQPNFWILMLTSNVPLGIFPGMMSVLPQVLAPYGISQSASDWIGLYCALAGLVGGVSFGRLADCLGHRTKLLLVLAMGGCALCFGVFCLICFGVIPFNPCESPVTSAPISTCACICSNDANPNIDIEILLQLTANGGVLCS